MDGQHDDLRALTVQLDTNLRTVVQPLAELVERIDAAIDEHVQALAQLRELRRQATRVTSAADPTSKPGRKPKAQAHAAVVATHQRARAAKKQRVHDAVLALGPGVDITSDVWGAVNGNGQPAISRGMIYDLLRELRDDGVLRLDSTGNGGKAHYRLVAGRD